MKKSIWVLLACLAILIVPQYGFGQADNSSLPFAFVHMAIGPAFPSFGQTIDTELRTNPLYASYGHLGGELGLGIALFNSFYLTLQASALWAQTENLVIANLTMWGVGARYYPFSNGLFLEIGGGFSRLVTGNAFVLVGQGFGSVVTLGYDFRLPLYGFTLVLLGSFQYAWIIPNQPTEPL